MLFFYNLLFPVVFLFFLPGLILKLIRRPGYKKTFWERFAIFSGERIREFQDWKGAIWLHAVSVGETNLALSLLKQWCKDRPEQKFVLSTTTTTAQEIARNKAPAQVKVIFCPVDWFFFVRRTLSILKPSALVIFETEIWPNMICCAKKTGASLFLVNTRISDRSFRGYCRFRIFFAPILRQFDRICAQTDLDRERLETICPDAKEHIKICGNIKFDQMPPEGPGFDYCGVFGKDCGPVVIAASTHNPEEELILKAFLNVQKKYPSARLCMVPRHAERGDELEDLLKKNNVLYHRRSKGGTVAENRMVLLADTTGELAKLIKGADLVIMGKTLAGNDEGQNIIEPAQMGKAIICGPKLRNFRQALDVLRKANAVCRIERDADLENAIDALLGDEARRNELGARASEVMSKNRGALGKTLRVLEEQL